MSNVVRYLYSIIIFYTSTFLLSYELGAQVPANTNEINASVADFVIGPQNPYIQNKDVIDYYWPNLRNRILQFYYIDELHRAGNLNSITLENVSGSGGVFSILPANFQINPIKSISATFTFTVPSLLSDGRSNIFANSTFLNCGDSQSSYNVPIATVGNGQTVTVSGHTYLFCKIDFDWRDIGRIGYVQFSKISYIPFDTKNDLIIGQISIPNTQLDTNDNLPIIPIRIPTEINVPISINLVKSLTASELSLFVPVILKIGSQTLIQNISIANLAAANTLNIQFNVTLQPEDVGLKTLSIKVDSENKLDESTLDNNEAIRNIHVINNKYTIVREAIFESHLYDDNSLRNAISVEPSNSSKPGNICSGNKSDSKLQITLKCVQKNILGINEPVDGCVIHSKINYFENAADAHAQHNQLNRPKGTLSPDNGDQYINIPVDGLRLVYTTSEFSGIYNLDFKAIDPTQQQIIVDSIKLNTKIKENLVSLDSLQEFLIVGNITKNPLDGFFTTQNMQS